MIQTGFIFRTDQKVYQIYKCSLACWFIASWLVGVADAWYNPIEGRYYTGKLIRSKKNNQRISDYLSNYNEMVAVAWSIAYAFMKGSKVRL